MQRAGLTLWSALLRVRQARTELLLFGFFFVVFALTAGRSGLCFDVFTSNYASWRLATAHTPYLDGVSIPELDHNSISWVWISEGANGHSVITRAPAAVIAGLPAYLLTRPDSMTVLPAAITAAAMTALSVLLVHRAVRTAAEPWQALAAAAVFGLTTPVWSVAANGIWPQTITVLGIAVAAWGASSERWWWVGAGGVLLLWARPHAAVIVAVVGLSLAWRERRIGIAVRSGVPGLLSLPLLCAWTHWVYGSWSPFPLFGSGAFAQVQQSLFDLPNQLAMWVAPDRGLFVYTPVLLLLLPTLVRVRRQLPAWSTALLLGGLAYTVLQAALIGYSGGYPIYGYRYGLEFLACATPAFAFAACRVAGLARRALAPVLALQFTVIAFGAVIDSMWLDDTAGWTNNAFTHTMYAHAPGAPLLALIVGCVALWVIRSWVRSRAGAAPAPEPPLPTTTGVEVLLAERR
ncbi:MAG: hypothetical protein QOD98_1073 [Nocardioidaceae bacterium]|jgi:alpha-1,2-mannosyltransferase|nr:hypothetical protein [Nocardioidaceae bacterium]